VPGYIPLSLEEIGSSEDGQQLVSRCHYGEQTGDLMRDPDMVFLYHNLPDGAATGLSDEQFSVGGTHGS
jgi:hypothetical protein